MQVDLSEQRWHPAMRVEQLVQTLSEKVVPAAQEQLLLMTTRFNVPLQDVQVVAEEHAKHPGIAVWHKIQVAVLPDPETLYPDWQAQEDELV